MKYPSTVNIIGLVVGFLAATIFIISKIWDWALNGDRGGQMTDPSDAVPHFQQALLAGRIPLQRGTTHKDLFVAQDDVNDHLRLSYLKLRDKTILALVQFVLIEPLDGLPCFHAGYAVPEQYRGQGIAKAAFAGALAELLQGFGRAGVAEFYVEAVVGENNLASQRICEAVLGGPAASIKDSVSGKSALRYLKHLNKRG
jgi:RimJ/RimL family protein N-acetyltransferase